ncbi:MAG: CDP-glycerol glycerophosphotransferase family protein [Alphaproteobacteria bacterium]
MIKSFFLEIYNKPYILLGISTFLASAFFGYLSFAAVILSILALIVANSASQRMMMRLSIGKIGLVKMDEISKPAWLPLILPFASLSALFPAIVMFEPKLALFLGATILAYVLLIFVQYKKAATTNSVTTATWLESYKPTLALVFSGPQDSEYQINQWIPVLEKLDEKVVIILRETAMYPRLTPTTLPVVFAKTPEDLESVFGETVRTALYPANSVLNAHAFRHIDIEHMFINHGESDKSVNQSKFLMAYDKLLVGGPLAERRLKESGIPIRPNQILHVGRPQADLLLNKASGNVPEKLRILYAPTWEGFTEVANYSSITKIGLDLVETLIADDTVELTFKPHPFSGSRKQKAKDYLGQILAICSRGNVTVLGSDVPISDAMNDSDLLITDVSSVLNEYLATEKPIVMCNTRNLPIQELHTEFTSSAAAYNLVDGTQISKMVTEIKADDSLSDQRLAVRLDSLGEFPEGAYQRFADVIHESINRD